MTRAPRPRRSTISCSTVSCSFSTSTAISIARNLRTSWAHTSRTSTMFNWIWPEKRKWISSCGRPWPRQRGTGSRRLSRKKITNLWPWAIFKLLMSPILRANPWHPFIWGWTIFRKVQLSPNTAHLELRLSWVVWRISFFHLCLCSLIFSQATSWCRRLFPNFICKASHVKISLKGASIGARSNLSFVGKHSQMRRRNLDLRSLTKFTKTKNWPRMA